MALSAKETIINFCIKLDISKKFLNYYVFEKVVICAKGELQKFCFLLCPHLVQKHRTFTRHLNPQNARKASNAYCHIAK